MNPEQRAEFIEEEVKRYYMDKVATRLLEIQGNCNQQNESVCEELDSHGELIDDAHQRLTRLEWLAVIATGWLGVLTVLLAWVAIR